MNSRQRILAVFEGKETDKIPVHHIGFSGDPAKKIMGQDTYVGGGIQQWREARSLWKGKEAHRHFINKSLQDAFQIAHVTGNDILRLHYWRYLQKPVDKKGEYQFEYLDEENERYTMKYNPEVETYGVVEQRNKNKILSYGDLEDYINVCEDSLKSYNPERDLPFNYNGLIKKYGAEYVIRFAIGMIEIPYDNEIWLEATLLQPELIERFLDVQAKKIVARIKVLANFEVKIVFGGGDMASGAGPFYSPETFKKLLLPRLQQITAECHKHSMYYLFGSDGNLWPVAQDLFGNSGIDGYYEIDRRAGMDLKILKERFPELTLLGNISCQTLHCGSVQEVEYEALSCMEIAREYKGIIVGVSNYIMPGTPVENIEILLKTIRDNR